jgi:hypothetical protein
MSSNSVYVPCSFPRQTAVVLPVQFPSLGALMVMLNNCVHGEYHLTSVCDLFLFTFDLGIF